MNQSDRTQWAYDLLKKRKPALRNLARGLLECVLQHGAIPRPLPTFGVDRRKTIDRVNALLEFGILVRGGHSLFRWPRFAPGIDPARLLELLGREREIEPVTVKVSHPCPRCHCPVQHGQRQRKGEGIVCGTCLEVEANPHLGRRLDWLAQRVARGLPTDRDLPAWWFDAGSSLPARTGEDQDDEEEV